MKQRARVTSQHTFECWKEYELMNKRVDIIRAFIDNGILDSDITLFQNIYREYMDQCDKFYTKIKEVYESNFNQLKEREELIDYSLDFANKIFIYETGEYDFNLKNFALNTLNLNPQFKITVSQVVDTI